MNKLRMGRFVLSLTALLFAACGGDVTAERDRYLKSGESYFQREEYQEAIIQYRNALQVDGNHAPTQLALARALQSAGDHPRAVAAFKRVLELNETDRTASLELVKYYLQAGSEDTQYYRRAQELVRTVLEANPDDLEARILLGNTYAGLDDLERSIEEMRTVLETDPENLVAHLNLGAFELKRQDAERAESIFLEVLDKHPESTSVHRALANLYAFTRRLDQAENHFQQAFELDSSDNTNLYSLVRFYLLTQRPDEAEATFRRAIEVHPWAREARWGLANLYIARDKSTEGIALLEAMAEENTNDQVVRLRLAELYLGQEETDRARRLVEEMLKGDQAHAGAYYLRGRLLLVDGDQDSALEEFDRAIELNRRLIPAYLQKASILLEKRDLPEAQEALKLVLRITPKSLVANAALAKSLALDRKPEEALERASQVLDIQPNNPDALFAFAEASLITRETVAAREAFERLAQLQPKNPLNQHRLGSVDALEGKDQEALRHFRLALRIAPGSPQIMNDILFLHMKNKRYEEALLEVDRFASGISRTDLLHVFRGKIFLAQQQFNDAEKSLRRAIRDDRTNYEAYMLLGQLQAHQNNLPQAIQEVDDLLESNPDFVPAHLLKGYYLDRMQNVSQAIEHYKKALELDENNAIAANNLAWLYCVNDQNLEEALHLATAARKQSPENPQFADTLGWIHYKMNNYTLAVDQLLFSVNNSRPGAEHYFRLGMAYYRKGDNALAKQTLSKALELDASFPGSEDAKRALSAVALRTAIP